MTGRVEPSTLQQAAPMVGLGDSGEPVPPQADVPLEASQITSGATTRVGGFSDDRAVRPCQPGCRLSPWQRQMLTGDQPSLAQDGRPFERIPQLPHVARPVIAHQLFTGIVRDARWRPTQFATEVLQKCLAQGQHVVRAHRARGAICPGAILHATIQGGVKVLVDDAPAFSDLALVWGMSVLIAPWVLFLLRE